MLFENVHLKFPYCIFKQYRQQNDFNMDINSI